MSKFSAFGINSTFCVLSEQFFPFFDYSKFVIYVLDLCLNSH